MIGKLEINGKDAYGEWGIGLLDGALSTLMTPTGLKNVCENKSNVEHGTQVFVDNIKVDERTFNLSIFLSAKTEDDFFAKYESFITELQTGKLYIKTVFQPNIVYKCLYVSCSQFSQLNRSLANFILRLREPNPMDRTEDDNN